MDIHSWKNDGASRATLSGARLKSSGEKNGEKLKKIGGATGLHEGGNVHRHRRDSISLERDLQEEADNNLQVKLEFLSHIDFISQLPRRQREMLALVSSVRLYQDEHVVQQGTKERKLYILCHGEILVTRKENPSDPYETEQALRVDHAPSFFGEQPLLTGEAHGESVMSLGQTVWLELDGQDFDTRLGSNDTVRNILELKKLAREAQVLDHIPLLAPINPMQRIQILHAMAAIAFDDGEKICIQGQRGETFFIIVQGQVMLQKRDEKNPSLPPRFMMYKYVNDFFGEQALLHDKPRSADVVAVGHVVCLYMHRCVFTELFPHLRQLLKEMSQECIPFRKGENDELVEEAGDDQEADAEQLLAMLQRKQEELMRFIQEQGRIGKYRFASSKRLPQSSFTSINSNNNDDEEAEAFKHSFLLEDHHSRLYAANMDFTVNRLIKSNTTDSLTGKHHSMSFESTYEFACHSKILQPYRRNQTGDFPLIMNHLRHPQELIPIRIQKMKNEVSLSQFDGKSKKKHHYHQQQQQQDRTELLLTSRLARLLKQTFDQNPHERSAEAIELMMTMFEGNEGLNRLALQDENVKRNIFRHAKYVCFSKGQTLIRQDGMVDGMFMILRGTVRLTIREQTPTRTNLRSLEHLSPGSICGELCMLDPAGGYYAKGFYDAMATTRTEALLLHPDIYHELCVPKKLLQSHLDSISSIQHLTCTCGEEPNLFAIYPLVYALVHETFPKDFVFSNGDGAFFQPNHVHFIVDGEVGVFANQQVQIAQLGPGEALSKLDCTENIALVAMTTVRTISIPLEMFQKLDKQGADTLKECSKLKQDWRAFTLERNLDIIRFQQPPSWTIRNNKRRGPLHEDNSEEDKPHEEKEKQYVMGGERATMFRRGSSLSKLFFPQAIDQPNSPGSPKERPLNIQKIHSALDIVRQHYSEDIETRHKVICPIPRNKNLLDLPKDSYLERKSRRESGNALITGRLKFSTKQSESSNNGEYLSYHQKKLERERLAFLNKHKQPHQQQTTMKQVPYAMPTKNWCLMKS